MTPILGYIVISALAIVVAGLLAVVTLAFSSRQRSPSQDAPAPTSADSTPRRSSTSGCYRSNEKEATKQSTTASPPRRMSDSSQAVRKRALLVLLCLAPTHASAESCADPSEWFQLELRGVAHIDGSGSETEAERWESEGSVVIGYEVDSFKPLAGTARLEFALRDGDLRITRTGEQ